MRRDRNFQFVEVVSSGSGSIGRIRREWADDYKAEMASRSLVPGVNASALAREIGISPGQLFGWRRFARDRGLLHDLENTPLAAERGAVSRAVIEIVVDGVTIRACSAADEGHLVRVIRAVRQA
ncbi:transposase [Asticcacaulis benevestitus]|nr:transposase [Asticcacaulis benevestitus]